MMSAPKPIAKPSRVRQIVLASLLDNRDKGLAKNVSWLNVDRMAARPRG